MRRLEASMLHHVERCHMPSRPLPRPRIGLFAIGLEAYWAQFTGLRELLVSYYAEIATQLRALGADVEIGRAHV